MSYSRVSEHKNRTSSMFRRYRGREGTRSLTRVAMRGTPRRVTAVAFAVAYLICLFVQPESSSSDPWWFIALAVTSIATIIVAVIALWAGARHAPALGVVTGVSMVAETFIYPDGYQHALGWWTWVQAVLSFGVLAASIMIVMAERSGRAAERFERISGVARAVRDDVIDASPSAEQVRLHVRPVVRDDAVDPRHDA